MLFLPKGNQQDNIEKDLDDDDDHIESGDEFDESEEIHFNVSSTLLTLKNGLKIKRRKHQEFSDMYDLMLTLMQKIIKEKN